MIHQGLSRMMREHVSLSEDFNRTIISSGSDNVTLLARENLQLKTPT